MVGFPNMNHVDFWFVLTWSRLSCGFFSPLALFDVSVERGSCVVIYMTYITLERKVFEIRFQFQIGVCFLSISWKREKGER